MKRLVLITTAFLITLSLFGCGESTPISEQHYSYGKKAVEIVDQYLDYKISAAEVSSSLSELQKREDELPEHEYGDDDHANNYHVEINTFLVSRKIENQKYSPSSESYTDILELRNKIAEAIGEKTR